MIRALHTAATGMNTQQANIDVIANNLANANTQGFKKSRPDFESLIYQQVSAAGLDTQAGQVPTGIHIGLGAKLAAVQKIFTTGDMQQTQNTLDIAIEGRGFFQVATPNGEIGYTRSGALKMDSEGRIVTSNGYPITPDITIPQNTTEISITEDGTVSAFVDGETTATELGTLELAVFTNDAGLKAAGHNLYLETAASGSATILTPGDSGAGTLLQGYLESSNTNIMEEMVAMISGQRAYEINSKAIKTADEMLQVISSLA